MDLQAAYDDAVRTLDDCRFRRSQLDFEIAELEVEIKGLARALDRHSDEGPPPRPHPWVAMNRTDAIVAVLTEAETPLSPGDVQAKLAAVGRVDGYNAVAASLSHLQDKRRAHKRGRGEWVAGPETSDLEYAVGDDEPF